jgi:excisionase family DNA binding protein
MNNTLLTAKQAQELLKVDRTTIYRMLKDGRLNGVKVGQQWRFYSSEVNDLVTGAQKSAENKAPISMQELPLHCMQTVQDVFAEIGEVGAVITGKEGHPLTRISNSCDFCKLILGSEGGRMECIASWRKLAEQKKTSPEFVACHAGLLYARARIEQNESLTAMLIAGQFHTESLDSMAEKKRIHRLAGTYSINEDLLTQAARQIPVLDVRKVSQISHWLEEVAHTFEQISSERADLMSRLRQIGEMSVFEKSIS